MYRNLKMNKYEKTLLKKFMLRKFKEMGIKPIPLNKNLKIQ